MTFKRLLPTTLRSACVLRKLLSASIFKCQEGSGGFSLNLVHNMHDDDDDDDDDDLKVSMKKLTINVQALL